MTTDQQVRLLMLLIKKGLQFPGQLTESRCGATGELHGQDSSPWISGTPTISNRAQYRQRSITSRPERIGADFLWR